MIRQVLKFAMTLSIIARILLTCLLNSFSQLRSSRSCGFLIGVIIPLPTYPLSAIQSAGSKVRRTPDSLRQWLSCRLPSMESEIHASFSARVQATWTFRPNTTDLSRAGSHESLTWDFAGLRGGLPARGAPGRRLGV